MTGSSRVKGQSTRGFAEVRNHLTEYFEENNSGYFYCIQEEKKAPFKNLYHSFQIPALDTKDAAIAGDKKHEYKKPPPKEAKKCCYNETARRYYGDQVSIDDGDVKHRFTLVSYHGHHNEEKTQGQMAESKKIGKIKEFFNEMLHVAETHEMTVIIGGDFNLPLQKWKSAVEDIVKGRIEVADEYEVGELRKGKEVIDTFAVVYPPDVIKHTRCKLGQPKPVNQDEALQAFDQKKEEKEKPLEEKKQTEATPEISKESKESKEKEQLTTRELYRLMDHDALAIKVELKTPKPDTKH